MKCSTCGQMNCMDHGGEVKDQTMDESPDAGVDDELMDMCAGELCDALEKKDKKAILESLKAICLSCME